MFEHFKNQEIVGYRVKADGNYVMVSQEKTVITYNNYSKLKNHALYCVSSSDNPIDIDYFEFQLNFKVDPNVQPEHKSDKELLAYEEAAKATKTLMISNYFENTFGVTGMIIYRDDDFMYRIGLDKNYASHDFNKFVSLAEGGLNPMDAYQMMMM